MEHENFRKYHLVTIRRNLRRRRIFHRQYRIIYHNHRYSLRAPDSQTRYIGIMALRKRYRTLTIAPRMPLYPDEHHLVFYRRNLDFPIAHFLGSPVLHHDYRYPIRNATFQISRTGTHSFRTRCKIKPFILQTIC